MKADEPIPPLIVKEKYCSSFPCGVKVMLAQGPMLFQYCI